MEIADRVIETDADVIVLNEFGFHKSMPWEDHTSGSELPVEYCRDRLALHGYTLHTSGCYFPTAIATRLPLAGDTKRFGLGSDRAAIAVPVHIGVRDEDKEEEGVMADPQRVLWIYGTHLEAGDDHNGAYRLENMECLLNAAKKQHPNLKGSCRMMVIGDLNQQRQQDYTEQEWKDISANKKRRDSPLNDGVATALQEEGFHCVFDKLHHCKCNWPKDVMPPPSTHWTGTLIDYSYFRGPGLQVEGVYVSPCGLSDHRMLVCDWIVEFENQEELIEKDSHHD